MPRPLYYTVRVTAENELGDRRTYDALDFADNVFTGTLNAARDAAQWLTEQLERDGYAVMIRSDIHAVTTTTEAR